MKNKLLLLAGLLSSVHMTSDAGQASLKKENMGEKPYELGLSQAEMKKIATMLQKNMKKYKIDTPSLKTTGFISPYDLRKQIDNVVARTVEKSGNIDVMQDSTGQLRSLMSRLKNTTGTDLSTVKVNELENSGSVSSDSKLVFVSVGRDQSILTEIAQKLPKGGKLMVLFWAGVKPPETLSEMKLELENPTFYEGSPFLSSRMPGTGPLALNLYEKK